MHRYAHVKFALSGSPADWTSVTGYDRTSYNGANSSARPGIDVRHVEEMPPAPRPRAREIAGAVRGLMHATVMPQVSGVRGVYAGWTASDVMMGVDDAARLAYDIYGAAPPRLLSPSSVRTMIPWRPFYGFATFNMSRSWGPSSTMPYNRAYGHLGATYGYDSIVVYWPAADVSIAIATSIETDTQTQPSDTACLAYNAVLAALTNSTEPKCEYVTGSYYYGVCTCGNDYRCDWRSRQCVRDVGKGTLSKDECDATCQ